MPMADVGSDAHPSSRPKELPEGFLLGDEIYYVGSKGLLANGDSFDFGEKGVVAGAGGDIRRVQVNFDKNPRLTKIVRVEWLSKEDPYLAGGYSIGDRIYWQGPKQSFATGNKVIFGLQGCITGVGSKDKRVNVMFDGNEFTLEVMLTQISSDHPVIPGGYEVDELVYYCGETERFGNGDILSNALTGRIQSRATTGDPSDERRVKVIFDGHDKGICVLLLQVRREVPKLPDGYYVGDDVTYKCTKVQNLQNGDRLEPGLRGTITGCSTLGDGSDDKRVKVRFDGNKGPVNVLVKDIVVGDDSDSDE